MIPEYVINIKETDITISIPSEVNIALLKSKNIISIINIIIKPVMMFDDTALRRSLIVLELSNIGTISILLGIVDLFFSK